MSQRSTFIEAHLKHVCAGGSESRSAASAIQGGGQANQMRPASANVVASDHIYVRCLRISSHASVDRQSLLRNRGRRRKSWQRTTGSRTNLAVWEQHTKLRDAGRCHLRVRQIEVVHVAHLRQ